jgi:hypothetical protein
VSEARYCDERLRTMDSPARASGSGAAGRLPKGFFADVTQGSGGTTLDSAAAMKAVTDLFDWNSGDDMN